MPPSTYAAYGSNAASETVALRDGAVKAAPSAPGWRAASYSTPRRHRSLRHRSKPQDTRKRFGVWRLYSGVPVGRDLTRVDQGQALRAYRYAAEKKRSGVSTETALRLTSRCDQGVTACWNIGTIIKKSAASRSGLHDSLRVLSSKWLTISAIVNLPRLS